MMVCRTSPAVEVPAGPPGQALQPRRQGGQVLAVLGRQAP